MPTIFFNQKTLTQQHNKKECDINNIMAKYQKSGVIDHVNLYQEHYHDCSAATYQDCQNQISNANSMFENLPSKARAKFNNDPATFLEYVQDPKNADTLYDLGLTNAPLNNEPPDQDESEESALITKKPKGGKGGEAPQTKKNK